MHNSVFDFGKKKLENFTLKTWNNKINIFEEKKYTHIFLASS